MCVAETELAGRGASTIYTTLHYRLQHSAVGRNKNRPLNSNYSIVVIHRKCFPEPGVMW